VAKDQELAAATGTTKRKVIAIAIFILSTGALAVIEYKKLLDDHATVKSVTEHVLTAFVAAAVVGFFYEMAGHAKRLEELLANVRLTSDRFLERLAALSETSEQRLQGYAKLLQQMLDQVQLTSGRFLERLAAITEDGERRLNEFVALVQREADVALPIALGKIFQGTPTDAKLLSRTEILLKSIRAIHTRGLWIDKISLLFIGELLDYASANADELASSDILKGHAMKLKLPLSSVVLADKILGGEMSVLENGDSYLVLSDFASWALPAEATLAEHDTESSLSQLSKATLSAATIEKGVAVKRLFCKFATDTFLTNARAEEILKRQWTLSHESPRREDGQPWYQVGILTRAMVDRVGLVPKHRGVFIHGDQAICFSPANPHLNLMAFEMASAETERLAFEKFWRMSVQSSFRDVEGQVTERNLDQVLAELGPSWWMA
jgi:hypothetical protein